MSHEEYFEAAYSWLAYLMYYFPTSHMEVDLLSSVDTLQCCT